MVHDDSTDQATRAEGAPLYKRWWFWAGLVVLAFGLWWGAGYYEFLQDTAESRQLGQDAAEYWQQLEEQSEALEEAYRNDPYGGGTPEETLDLFVEALEAKDFELAAKYFVVENQEQALEDNVAAEPSGNDRLVVAYQNGTLVPPDGVGASGIYEVEIYEVGDDEVPFRIRLVKNEFTGKWKILEL